MMSKVEIMKIIQTIHTASFPNSYVSKSPRAILYTNITAIGISGINWSFLSSFAIDNKYNPFPNPITVKKYI